jgi:hypothetical protein
VARLESAFGDLEAAGSATDLLLPLPGRALDRTSAPFGYLSRWEMV